jgi:hypothetical protein
MKALKGEMVPGMAFLPRTGEAVVAIRILFASADKSVDKTRQSEQGATLDALK